MSTNHTKNYSLCQWEETDQVLRADFNADNARLEATLNAVNDRLKLLERVNHDLACYVSLFDLARKTSGEMSVPQYSIYSMPLNSKTGPAFTVTSGLTFQADKLVLSGTKGTVTGPNITIERKEWTQARLWVQHNRAGVQAQINGHPMERVGSTFTRTFDRKDCIEAEFVYNGPAESTAQITLELETSSGGMEIYNYRVAAL